MNECLYSILCLKQQQQQQTNKQTKGVGIWIARTSRVQNKQGHHVIAPKMVKIAPQNIFTIYKGIFS